MRHDGPNRDTGQGFWTEISIIRLLAFPLGPPCRARLVLVLFRKPKQFSPQKHPQKIFACGGLLDFLTKVTGQVSAAGEKNDDLWLYLEILLRKNEGFLWDLWKYQVFLSGNLQNLKISYASSLKSPKSRNILCFFQVRRHKIVYPKPKQSENCLGYSLKK